MVGGMGSIEVPENWGTGTVALQLSTKVPGRPDESVYRAAVTVVEGVYE